MRSSSRHEFLTPDGTALSYRFWQPTQPAAGGTLVLFHRGHEHSGRWQGTVDALQLNDFNIFAWDQRGCGHSPGKRGHARHLSQLEEDMQAFLDHLAQQHQVEPENTIVLAHSLAAVTAALWAVDYAPRLRGLILATPALAIKLYVPLARPALGLARHLGWMEEVHSYVRGAALTHDRQEAQSYDQDPLISKQISTDLLLQLHAASGRLQACASNLEVPTQVLCARADWVVKNRPIRDFFKKLPCPENEIRVYRGFYHSLFHEKDRHLVLQDVRRFILERFSRPTDRSHLVRADRFGASAEQYEWHKAGLPKLHPKAWMMFQLRWALKTLGNLSQGMRLGLRQGFSSGTSLDYVYENQARGWGPLGRWLDGNYLNAIGWRRVRQRRQHLLQLLQVAVGERESFTLLDVAAGPAGYLIEFFAARPHLKAKVIVGDRSPEALNRARQLAAKDERFQFVTLDALDSANLAAIGAVDVALVSGLYELIPQNTPIQQSLQGLAAIVQSGGSLLYTNQPYHPQLELIAETLTHADGSAWVMRCRSSAEIDELVRQAGFDKRHMRIDEDGIFTVSLAQKREAP